MPLDLPLWLRLEANKLHGSHPWLLLLEVTLTAEQVAAATAAGLSVGSGVLRFVRNTENIPFDSQTWTAFAFTLGEQGQSGDGKIPSVPLRVGNANRALTPYLEACGGLTDAAVRLMTVYEGNMATPADFASLTLTYTITSTYVPPDNIYVEFTLGMENLMRRRFPVHTAVPLHCNWKRNFKDAECNYLSGAASNQVASATIYAAGSGGSNGTQTVTGTTGTGRKFQASVTVAGGVITAVLSILYGGSYTADPTVPGQEPVTGASLTGAKLAVVMEAETCGGSLLDCQYKGNTRRFGGRPGITGAPKFVR